MSRRNTPEDPPPQQPIVMADGVLRFRKNAVLRWLVDQGHVDLNKIDFAAFDGADVAQFYQLFGYSVSAFGGLDFIPDELVDSADRAAKAFFRRLENPKPQKRRR
jgi:hypothetical protein